VIYKGFHSLKVEVHANYYVESDSSLYLTESTLHLYYKGQWVDTAEANNNCFSLRIIRNMNAVCEQTGGILDVKSRLITVL
jgi:hypothetical protein